MLRWFAKNDIATNLIMIGILFVGFFICLPSMPVEINPTHKYQEVRIDFRVKGMTPEDVERKICLPVENKLRFLKDIESIYGKASYSRAWFSIKATDTANLKELKNEIEDLVSNISTLPSEAEKPYIYIPDPNQWYPVMSVVITGELNDRQLLGVGRQVRDQLSSTPGVSYTTLRGDGIRKFYIEPKLETLRTHDITLNDISKAIRDNSIDLTAGRISSSSRGIQVTAKNQAFSVLDFSNINIKSNNGSELKIGSIAHIRDSFDDQRKIFTYDGKPCARVEVLRLQHENALSVAEEVYKYVEKTRNTLPDGINLHVVDDFTVSLRSRISILKENLMQGAILVFIVLALFLRPSLAFFVILGVPVSFAGGLILMNLLGVSINMWTLFGFIIVLGIVVDDAIVTAESIHRRLETQNTRLDAVVAGTKDVATPVTFGILTTIVAFTPLLFFSGWMGTISRQIPLVIIPVLLFSLVESKFILPGHLKHNYTYLKSINPFPFIHKGVHYITQFAITQLYKPILRFAVAFRHAVILLFIGLMLTTLSYLSSDHFKYNTVPSVDRYTIVAKITMPSETKLEETKKETQKVIEMIDQLRSEFPDGKTGKSLLGSYFSSVGGGYWGSFKSGTSYTMIAVTPPSQRDPDTKPEDMVSNAEIAKRWRELIGEKMHRTANLSVFGDENKSRHFADHASIEFEIRGQNEIEKKAIADEMETWLKQQEWASYSYTNRQSPSKQLNFETNENGVAAGLTNTSLARQVRMQLYGETVQRFYFGDNEVHVSVRLPDEERESTHALNTLRVKTKNGESSLKSVANLVETSSIPSIERYQGSRITKVYTGVKEEWKSSQKQHVRAIENKLDELLEVYPSTSWQWAGYVRDNKKTERFFQVGGVALFFVLFALLAIPFKSVIQPIFVLLAIPLGVIGALLGHYFMDVTVSYLSLFGILALSGVVVNDSLVMVDFINQKHRNGEPLLQSVLESGAKRFRPILLTSITTFAGLYPIMTEKSIEAKFLIPMAVSLGFGILFATLITLILIPCAYMVSEDLKKCFGWFFTNKWKSN